ncbi:alpha/beta hydrolase [Dactylosporangium sp. CA-052675]|uniref:alpha/beta hydrolase n=1 Tax=Dactylosporangium sp. CA-052675 TaxID=3239927 RepID=UPI003D91BDEE
MLLTLTGFVCVVDGVVEFGPEAPPAAAAVGVALLLAGLLAWGLVASMRRPHRSTVRHTAIVLVAVVAAGVAQFALLHAVVALLTTALPILALWRVGRGRVQPAPGRAVPLTTAALAMLTGAALTLALLPTHLPASAAVPGLRDDQSPTTPPEPEPSGYVTATDGTKLAYFADLPADPVATLVFYHGSGANAGAGYLTFAHQLTQQYRIATYLFDMRGHGRSGGRRGDAPSQGQMFADTQTAVDFVKHAHPRLPEYVGGHSAGAGLVLNSERRIDHEVAGYVYLAPDFGLHSDTERQSEAANFATIDHRVLISYVLTNGLLDAHAYAVSFAYAPADIARAGLVSRYTSVMAVAQNAGDSAAILAGTDKPVGVWIGSDDEVFDPAKVLAFARHAPHATTATVAGADHLGVIDGGITDVGAWLDRQAGR